MVVEEIGSLAFHFLPQPVSEGGVAVLGNHLPIVVFHPYQPLLTIVYEMGIPSIYGLLNKMSIGIILVTRIASLDKLVGVVVGPTVIAVVASAISYTIISERLIVRGGVIR